MPPEYERLLSFNIPRSSKLNVYLYFAMFSIGLFHITCDSICYAYMLSPVRLSVRRADHTKTVEVGIMKFSPYDGPIPLVFAG